MNRNINPELTQAIVQAQVTQYFHQALGEVPAGLSLSYAAPIKNLQDLDPSATVPCDDNDQTATGPLNVQDGYWVHGIVDGQQQATLDRFGSAFSTLGWRVSNDNNGTIRGVTPDGYALIADLNTVGSMSLSGSTPCFPRANTVKGIAPVTAIPHP